MPLLGPKPYTPELREAAFWAKVDKTGHPRGCWTWTGAVTSKWGYGCFQTGGRVLGAHKVAWIYTNGDPGKLCVLHDCDNRVCVNPAHLFLGTKQDNALDMVGKGRGGCMGERNWTAKLTEAQVIEIRSKYRRTLGRGGHTISSNVVELALEYGVLRGTIKNAALGRTWKHLR